MVMPVLKSATRTKGHRPGGAGLVKLVTRRRTDTQLLTLQVGGHAWLHGLAHLEAPV